LAKQLRVVWTYDAIILTGGGAPLGCSSLLPNLRHANINVYQDEAHLANAMGLSLSLHLKELGRLTVEDGRGRIVIRLGK